MSSLFNVFNRNQTPEIEAFWKMLKCISRNVNNEIQGTSLDVSECYIIILNKTMSENVDAIIGGRYRREKVHKALMEYAKTKLHDNYIDYVSSNADDTAMNIDDYIQTVWLNEEDEPAYGGDGYYDMNALCLASLKNMCKLIKSYSEDTDIEE